MKHLLAMRQHVPGLEVAVGEHRKPATALAVVTGVSRTRHHRDRRFKDPWSAIRKAARRALRDDLRTDRARVLEDVLVAGAGVPKRETNWTNADILRGEVALASAKRTLVSRGWLFEDSSTTMAPEKRAANMKSLRKYLRRRRTLDCDRA